METQNGGPYPAQHTGYRAAISRNAHFFLDSSNNLKYLPKTSFKTYAFPSGPGHLVSERSGSWWKGCRSSAVRVMYAMSLHQGLCSRGNGVGALASVFSDLQGPLLQPTCSDSRQGRAGRGHSLAPPSLSLRGLSLWSPSQSSSWGTSLSPRTPPCPGPALTSPRQSLKFPSSSTIRATSSRLPRFSTTGTSEMGMFFPP